MCYNGGMAIPTRPPQAADGHSAHFRVRARTVSLLGLEQVSGMTTAFSELLRNALDAHATRTDFDYHRTEQTLVVRDNGLGMTHRDILDHWLVVGTAHKVRTGYAPEVTVPPPGRGDTPRHRRQRASDASAWRP